MEFEKNTDYQLFEENVHDDEFEKKKKFKKCFIIALVVFILALLTTAALYYFWIAANNDKQTSSNKEDIDMCPKNPQYPMAGGSGCANACAAGLYSGVLNYDYDDATWDSDGFLTITEQVTIYLEQQQANAVISSNYDEFDDGGIHMTIDYFCCLTPAQLAIIDEVAGNYTWPTMNISFTHMRCWRNGCWQGVCYKTGEIVEIMVYLDDPSQTTMLNAVSDFENLLNETYGVPIKVPRKDNVGFHVTMAFLNGTEYEDDIPEMLNNSNSAVDWSNITAKVDGIICNDAPFTIGYTNYTCLKT